MSVVVVCIDTVGYVVVYGVPHDVRVGIVVGDVVVSLVSLVVVVVVVLSFLIYMLLTVVVVLLM